MSSLIGSPFQWKGGRFVMGGMLAEWQSPAYEHLFDKIPVWAFFLGVLLVALGPIEMGQRWGARRRRMVDAEPVGPVGSVVGATLALLGFMVALTVSTANSRFDSRKTALIDGVNAIENAYRNASLLPEPHNSESRKLLREYVAMRLEMPNYYGDPVQLQKLDARIRLTQRTLWSHAEALAKQDQNSKTYLLFAASLNEVCDIHNKRVILGAEYRIPILLWAILMIVTIICMFGVGFLFGLSGNRSLAANLLLVGTYALVIALIFDLDQPGEGWIDVNQQPMYDLHERLRATE